MNQNMPKRPTSVQCLKTLAVCKSMLHAELGIDDELAINVSLQLRWASLSQTRRQSTAYLNLHNDLCQLRGLRMFPVAHSVRTPAIAATKINHVHAKLFIHRTELPLETPADTKTCESVASMAHHVGVLRVVRRAQQSLLGSHEHLVCVPDALRGHCHQAAHGLAAPTPFLRNASHSWNGTKVGQEDTKHAAHFCLAWLVAPGAQPQSSRALR